MPPAGIYSSKQARFSVCSPAPSSRPAPAGPVGALRARLCFLSWGGDGRRVRGPLPVGALSRLLSIRTLPARAIMGDYIK